jgi:RNA polymerase sigma-70 factor (ECF subfamily)
MDSERRLVDLVLQGDRPAFRELIARYERLVRHVVVRLVDDPHDAEEVFQDVWVRVYRGLPNYRWEASLSTWIGRIAFNTAAKRVRREMGMAGNSEPVSLADDAELNRPALAAEPARQLESLLSRELQEHVRAQVARLPPEQRLAISLHYLDGLAVGEVAEIMGAPENTVKSHLFRGRKTLKALLRERIP